MRLQQPVALTQPSSIGGNSGTMFITGVVQDVDLENKIAHVNDPTGSSYLVTLRYSTGKMVSLPEVGETWVITKQTNFWVFYMQADVDLVSNPPTIRARTRTPRKPKDVVNKQYVDEMGNLKYYVEKTESFSAEPSTLYNCTLPVNTNIIVYLPTGVPKGTTIGVYRGDTNIFNSQVTVVPTADDWLLNPANFTMNVASNASGVFMYTGLGWIVVSGSVGGLPASLSITSAPLLFSVMGRDGSGRAQVNDPSAGLDIANKEYVDTNSKWFTLGTADLSNSWALYDDGAQFPPVRFRKSPTGRVTLSGLIKSGTTGTTIFQLPAGYRPGGGTRMFTTVANGVAALITIDTSGNIQWNSGGTSSYISLDGITFMSATDVLDSSWTAPTLLNSWTNYGSGWCPAGYYIDSYGVVHLRGLVAGGASVTTAFTLPVGYRPTGGANLIFATAGVTSNIARIDIDTAGNVTLVVLTGGANTWISLDGIQFWSGGSGSYNGKRSPVLINSWVNFASGYENSYYRVDPDGYVMFGGLIKSGTASSMINNALTTDLRSPYQNIYPAVAGPGGVRLDATVGQINQSVYYGSGTNAYVSLSNIGYYPIGT